MNWILVAFVFNVSPSDDLTEPRMLYRGFPSEASCNAAGEHFRDEFLLPEATKSVSICIDKAAFDSADWQILETPKSETPAAARSSSNGLSSPSDSAPRILTLTRASARSARRPCASRPGPAAAPATAGLAIGHASAAGRDSC